MVPQATEFPLVHKAAGRDGAAFQAVGGEGIKPSTSETLCEYLPTSKSQWRQSSTPHNIRCKGLHLSWAQGPGDTAQPLTPPVSPLQVSKNLPAAESLGRGT